MWISKLVFVQNHSTDLIVSILMNVNFLMRVQDSEDECDEGWKGEKVSKKQMSNIWSWKIVDYFVHGSLF